MAGDAARTMMARAIIAVHVSDVFMNHGLGAQDKNQAPLHEK